MNPNLQAKYLRRLLIEQALVQSFDWKTWLNTGWRPNAIMAVLMLLAMLLN